MCFQKSTHRRVETSANTCGVHFCSPHVWEVEATERAKVGRLLGLGKGERGGVVGGWAPKSRD
jgi:hypothetical protein